ncbi:hypothetical protein RSAG8_01753, partial [Rhizoctonia solani AG-8 WAC10335]
MTDASPGTRVPGATDRLRKQQTLARDWQNMDINFVSARFRTTVNLGYSNWN